MKFRTAGIAVAIAGLGLAACSSGGPAQSSLGPFSMTACKMGWTDGTADGQFFTSQEAAAGAPEVEIVSQTSEFTITLTATAVVQYFTVAYYNSAGTEIGTGQASLQGTGPNELTAGQHATFMDERMNGPLSGAASCHVISGNGN